MKIMALHMENFRGIRRLDPDGDDFTLPIGKNKTEEIHTPWALFRGTSAPAGCSRGMVSRKGP